MAWVPRGCLHPWHISVVNDDDDDVDVDVAEGGTEGGLDVVVVVGTEVVEVAGLVVVVVVVVFLGAEVSSEMRF